MRPCSCGDLDDGSASEAARLLCPCLRDAEGSVGEVSIGCEHGLGAVKFPWHARGVGEFIRVGDGAASARECGHRCPRKKIGGALDLVAFPRDTIEGEEWMMAVIYARLGNLRYSIGAGASASASASASGDGEEQLVNDETRIQNGAAGRSRRCDLHAGEVRHGDGKGPGRERAAADGGGAVVDSVLLGRGIAARTSADARNPQRLPCGKTGDIAQRKNERLIIIGDEIVSIVDLKIEAARDTDAVSMIPHSQNGRGDARRGDGEIKADARAETRDIRIRRTQPRDGASDFAGAETDRRLSLEKAAEQ